MEFNIFGKTHFNTSRIGLGTWQIGGKWGTEFNDSSAQKILETAVDSGINFIDTADVYSGGLSEKAIGKFLKNYKKDVFVATKCGRQLNPHTSEAYTPKVLRQFVEDSLARLQIDCIDLIQLHCPPTEVYYRPEIFGLFDDLKTEGKIKHLGVSIEKIEEGLKAINYENVVSVQIIFNMLRQRPAELFFEECTKKNIGIIARVPLASGLLTGQYNSNTSFGKEDHRAFNRNGEHFDKGETFSGIPYELGVELANEIKEILGSDFALSHYALKWILMHKAVSVVIPGSSNADQVSRNLLPHDMPNIEALKMESIKNLYQKHFSNTIHHWW